jgi:PEP-CTERM motif
MSLKCGRLWCGALGLLLWSTAAHAGSISGVAWNGANFTIELISSDAATNTYQFEYVADFDGFDFDDHTDYITGINFKPSAGSVTGGTLTDFAVNGVSQGTGGWVWGVDSNLSSTPGGAADCDPNGVGNDFFCAIVDPFATAWNSYTTSGSPEYSWTFSLVITGVTDPDALVANTPIRASFSDGPTERGTYQNTLMSETTGTPSPTPVPEPYTGILFGLGAVACLAGAHKGKR